MLKENSKEQELLQETAEVLQAMPAAHPISKNKEIFSKVCQSFENFINNKFHIIKRKFYDSYFIFDMEENSIMHFEIAEIPNYLFGAWLGYDKEKDKIYIDFFCQHKLYIDKFKPSRGDFNIRVYIGKKDRDIEYKNIYFYELENMINFMYKHEALFFCCGDDITNYIPEWKAKIKMFNTIMNTKRYNRNKRKTFKTICLTLKKLKKQGYIDYYYMPDYYNRDKNSDEWEPHCNDRWIVLTLNKKGKRILKKLKSLKNKHLALGNLVIYDNNYPEDIEKYKDYVKYIQDIKSNLQLD